MESDINVQKGHHTADKKMHGGQFTASASLLLGDSVNSVNYSVNYPLKN